MTLVNLFDDEDHDPYDIIEHDESNVKAKSEITKYTWPHSIYDITNQSMTKNMCFF